MSISNSLNAKRTLRAKTPKFQRHANHRKASLNDHWSRPRGLHNKQKDHKKGSFPRVSTGYRTPVELRGQHISGYSIVHVANTSELAGIDPKTQAVVVAGVGAKMQIAILTLCQEKKIKVLNHNPEKRIAFLQGKHTAAKEAAEASRKLKAEKEAKKPKKESVEEKLTSEEKKEQEEKIKEEVLTGKQ